MVSRANEKQYSMGMEFRGVLGEAKAIFNRDGIPWCLERSKSNIQWGWNYMVS